MTVRRGFFYYQRWWNRRKTWQIIVFLLVIFVIFVLIYSTAQLRPLLEQLATTRVSNAVTRIVNQAVDETVGTMRYEELVALEKDESGRVSAIRCNMSALNRLQAEILDLILQRIDTMPPRDLSIPLGNLTGFALLAGRGPRIAVRMESVGSSTSEFENEFASAGINQTKHLIVLRVNVNVAVLLPGFTTATTVANSITVAETVIVGTVPDTYTYFASDAYQNDTKDYILNRG